MTNNDNILLDRNIEFALSYLGFETLDGAMGYQRSRDDEADRKELMRRFLADAFPNLGRIALDALADRALEIC
jgi:beta-xylosidase